MPDDRPPSGPSAPIGFLIAGSEMVSFALLGLLLDYAFGKRSAEELYDLAKDPDQVKNVADDPAYAEKRKELADQLLAKLKEAGDPRVVEEDCRFERPPFTDGEPPRGR